MWLRPRPTFPGGAALPSADRAAWAFAEAFARLIKLAPRPAEVATLDPAPSWAAWLTPRPACGRVLSTGKLRWSGDNLLVAHDWDSVTADSEAVLAGFAAALYSTVSADELATVGETEQFLAAYGDARGRLAGRFFSGVDAERAEARG